MRPKTSKRGLGDIGAVSKPASRSQNGSALDSGSIIGAMNLDLTDTETEALTQELVGIIEGTRYPLSPRIQTLRAILAKLRPEPVRESLPPRKIYEPPSKGRYRTRG
jgi:hypothetical protein